MWRVSSSYERFIDVCFYVDAFFDLEPAGGGEIVGHAEGPIQCGYRLQPGIRESLGIPEMLMRVDDFHFLVGLPRRLIGVKHFFHLGPPFAFAAGVEGLLHRHHDGPPLLRSWIGGHFGHVGFVIGAVIFEIAEEEIVFQIDGIIADIAFADHVENVGPDGSVISLVFSSVSGLTLITEP